jgi:peptidylprolyl isomerase
MTKTSPLYVQRLTIISAAFLLAVSTSATANEDLVWNLLDPENTVYLQMQEGTAVILLNPDFAPETVKHFKALLEDQFYRGMSFYRVIDGFVAQGGDGSDIEPGEETAGLKAEFEIDWPLKPEDKEAAKNWQPMSWTPVQTDDLFAPFTGFIDGFPAARDRKKGGKAWLTHCPGTVAMARNEDPDSGNTDFYIVIGQAPRYLDRNLTVFGRVVWGMDTVQRIKRGPALKNGIIEEDLERTWINRMRLATSVDEQELLDIWMADTNSRGFTDMLEERRNRKAAFFHKKPPKVLDVCQVPVPVRLEKRPSPRS